MKSIIDRIWENFWSGGITNPLTVIEQITYLLFIKGLDEVEKEKERNANLLKIEPKNKIFGESNQICRWSQFRELDAQTMYDVVQDKVFPFIKELGENEKSGYAKYMKDAIFIIPSPVMLQRVITAIDKLEMKDRDTKGDVYEYLLSKLSIAGRNGQFRTPRHIIKMMIDLVQPTLEDTIVDPACGSAGFLTVASQYIRDHSDDKMTINNLRNHFQNTMFYGFDMDRTMLRIGAMNLLQHGIDNPNIQYQDSLSQDNTDSERYSLVLANPPFKGSIDEERISKDLLAVTKTKRTELLFLALFLKIMKLGGRAGTIVPEGVLFGSSNAHRSIRREIIENHKLDAVISMPSGIFKPYAGVSTAVMLFHKMKKGETDQVWFYDMKADGFSLDDQRVPIQQNDIPDIIYRYHHLEQEKKRKRTEQSFFVSKEELKENHYELSINRYKETIEETKEYQSPVSVLEQIMERERALQQKLQELKEME